jgi:hypothetical protein
VRNGIRGHFAGVVSLGKSPADRQLSDTVLHLEEGFPLLRILTAPTLTLALCFALTATLIADDAAKSDAKFVSLYNGKNLDGWEVQDGDISAWQADGENLSCVKKGGGWLRSAKKYSDFVLRLEYKLPPGGNSGVGLRFPDKGNPAFVGIEVQILDDDDPQYKDIKEAQHTGSLYYEAAAKQGAAKPDGEWNTYEITCLGRHITVVLNGTVINDVDLDKLTTSNSPDHSALADRPEYGRIGFQSHDTRVDFRDIEVKDLTTTTPSGLIISDVKEGQGDAAPKGATITAHYTGRFVDGKKFDSSHDRNEPITFPLQPGGVIRGWVEGIPGMKVGGRRKLVIPPELAYGKEGYGAIPPNSTLVFDVELISFEK